MPADTARLSDVIAWYASNARRSTIAVNAPAAADAIDASWPDDLRDLFATCDGETSDSSGIFDNYRLLSLADARRVRDELIDTTTEPEDLGERRYSGFTRREVEGAGNGLPDEVWMTTDGGRAFRVPGGVESLSEQERLEWEERELQHSGQIMALLRHHAEKYGDIDEDEEPAALFTINHFPIAQWDNDVIVVDVSSGAVFVWTPVDGRIAELEWASVGALFGDLLTALRQRAPFMWQTPTVESGIVEWEFLDLDFGTQPDQLD